MDLVDPAVATAKIPSAGNVMLTIFWDQEGISIIDFLREQPTMTGSYYAKLMSQLRQSIVSKRREKLGVEVCLLHDNAPAHKSHVAARAIPDTGFEEVNHPAYNTDLGPSDYHLLSYLKRHLRGKRSGDDNEIIRAEDEYLSTLYKNFYSAGSRKPRGRYSRVITSEGQYIT